jgi:hypothetical protein
MYHIAKGHSASSQIASGPFADLRLCLGIAEFRPRMLVVVGSTRSRLREAVERGVQQQGGYGVKIYILQREKNENFRSAGDADLNAARTGGDILGYMFFA